MSFYLVVFLSVFAATISGTLLAGLFARVEVKAE